MTSRSDRPLPDGDRRPVRQRTLLLIDEDEGWCEILRHWLTGHGYRVVVATDGVAGLQLARTTRPAAVILDVLLPKITGAKLCWLLRQDPALRHTPIIVCSALSPRDFAWFPELSADAYVAKGRLPGPGENLLRALRGVTTAPPDVLHHGILGFEVLQPHRLVRELLAERARLYTLVACLEPSALEVDGEGVIVLATPAACQMLGRLEVHLLGEKLQELCPADEQPRMAARIAGVARRNKSARIPMQLCGRDFTLALARIEVDGGAGSVLVLLEPSAGRPCADASPAGCLPAPTAVVSPTPEAA